MLCGVILPYCRELCLPAAGRVNFRFFSVYGVTVSGLPKVPFFTVFSLVPPPESFVLTSI